MPLCPVLVESQVSCQLVAVTRYNTRVSSCPAQRARPLPRHPMRGVMSRSPACCRCLVSLPYQLQSTHHLVPSHGAPYRHLLPTARKGNSAHPHRVRRTTGTSPRHLHPAQQNGFRLLLTILCRHTGKLVLLPHPCCLRSPRPTPCGVRARYRTRTRTRPYPTPGAILPPMLFLTLLPTPSAAPKQSHPPCLPCHCCSCTHTCHWPSQTRPRPPPLLAAQTAASLPLGGRLGCLRGCPRDQRQGVHAALDLLVQQLRVGAARGCDYGMRTWLLGTSTFLSMQGHAQVLASALRPCNSSFSRRFQEWACRVLVGSGSAGGPAPPRGAVYRSWLVPTPNRAAVSLAGTYTVP